MDIELLNNCFMSMGFQIIIIIYLNELCYIIYIGLVLKSIYC